MRKAALTFAFSVLTVSSSFGGEAEKVLVERWYGALEKIDRAAFGDLLSDKAKITLGDLDIIQTKAEFIVSLDEWQDAMRGATIRHAIDSDADGLITVSVCYKFPDNEALGREVFAFEGSKIVGSEQETIADTCESFPG
jgi:hypothetical protein